VDIIVQVQGDIDLSTPVGQHHVQVSEDDWTTEAQTLGDVVAAQISAAVQRDDGYRTFKKRVLEIQDEQIHEQVRPVVAAAIEASTQPTNAFGHPTGAPLTLTELIVKEAREVLTKRADYGRGSTYLEKVVAEAVDKAIKKELAEAITDEKAKVVAAVRAKAADLIAQAVREGVGR
jgi:ubiquinone biosynthesis protein UbiJ